MIIYDLIQRASKGEDFLNYIISAETEKKYSETAILAHCLWNVTAFLFNE